jgi:hypothetical protein
MKHIFRNWLGINEDVQAIAADMNMLHERSEGTAMQVFELFHAMPFAAGAIGLTAKDAARLTQPNGIQANSLTAMLMGILLNARQGHSLMQVTGTLSDDVREALIKRGFKVEDTEGTGGKTTHILWT